MKLSQTVSLLTSLLVTPLVADTIVLKTGQKYEGSIISEDATSYLVAIQVTKSIKDERKILKDNVAEIIKESTAEKDFEALGSLTPTPDRLSAAAYESRIKKAKAFIAIHAKSPQGEKATASLAILEREFAVISKGGTKLGGQLIPASEIKSNAYDIDALLIGSQMKKLAQQGLHQQSLRKWEELKKNYPHSKAYIDSLPLARTVLQTYQVWLDQQVSSFSARTQQRINVFLSLDKNDRDRAEQRIKQKNAAYDILLQKEQKELKTCWVTIDVYNKGALEYNQRNAQSNLEELARIDSSSIKLAGPSHRGAWAALAGGKINEAAGFLKDLKSLKLPENYTAPIMAQISDKEMAMKKAEVDRKEQERAAKEAAKKAEKEAKMAAKKAEEAKKAEMKRKKKK